MPKFLHEYKKFDNGTKIDNGYWEIEGDKLVNRFGGWHHYEPSDGDEVIEGEWETVIPLMVRDDSQMTGWIAPDGTFYGCCPQDHADLATYILKQEETTLENTGYIKIYENPIRLRVENPDLPPYDFFCNRHPTEAQRKVLRKKGLE